MRGSFKVHVGGILGGMAEVLDNAVGAGTAPEGYVSSIIVRSGQLNREGIRDTLKAALAALTKPLPLIILCYVLGNDVRVDADGALVGAPLAFRHDCAFAVICADADARGQSAQIDGTALRPGLIQMLDDVRTALGGVQFVARDTESGVDFDLNETPLVPAGVEPIEKVPNVGAYAQHFLTSFYFSTPDRREVPVPVGLINFGIDPMNAEGRPTTEAPGVHLGAL